LVNSEVAPAQENYEPTLTLEIFLAVISCCFSLLVFYRAHLFAGPLHFTGDFADPLIQAARLEHWFGVFRGRYHWRDPIFFYPEKNILGYNDAYFLYGVLYSVYRSFGFDQLISMELTSAVFRAIGFLSTWLLLRRYFGTGLGAAALGSALMTFSNGIYLGAWHTQLATLGLAPLALVLGARVHELLESERRFAAGATAAGLAALVAGWMMTAFYTIFMSGVFVLVAMLVFAIYDRQSCARVLGDFVKDGRWRSLLPAVCVFVVGLVPFALTYGPAATVTGMHPLAEVLFFAPVPLDLIDVGSGNLVWGWLSEGLRAMAQIGERGVERRMGFTYVELGLVVVIAVAGGRVARSARGSLSGDMLRVLAIGVLVGLLLEVKVGDFSLWTLVYKFVPGGRGVRVVARYQLILLAAGAIVSAVAVDRLARGGAGRRLAAIGIGAALLLEQINVDSIAHLTRAQVAAAIAPVAAPPPACKAFFATHPPRQGNQSDTRTKYYLHATQAMLIAATVGVPTLNGMDSFYPLGHNLFSPLDNDYELRAYWFASRHGLLDGLCAFDLTEKTWRIVSGPPPAPRTHPLGAGLVDHDRILFSADQPGVAMLADGWSSPEDWGTWATGLMSTLTVRLQHDVFAASGAKMVFSACAFLPPGVSAKAVKIYLSDPPASTDPITTWTLAPDRQRETLCIPGKEIPSDRPITLTFRAERSYSPSQSNLSGDARVLDFAFSEFTVDADSCDGSP
jgi:hypothetical protein